MTTSALHGFLWLARSGLRLDADQLTAGHGFADPQYRPPRLPYLSIVGPLNIETESERDTGRAGYVWARSAGHLLGQSLEEASSVPANGDLSLLLDDDTEVSFSVDFGDLTGDPIDDAVGRAMAAAISAAYQSALPAGATVDGNPVDDSARLEELSRVTIRWSEVQRRVVISSGRRGTVATPGESGASSVALNIETPLAVALGLGEGSIEGPSKIVRHRVSSPTAVAVDVRLDLWASAQQQLSEMFERWSQLVPTRGGLLIRPALLAQSVDAGATTLALLTEGEPRNTASLMLAEFAQSGIDRLTGNSFELTSLTMLEAEGLRVSGSQAATLRTYRAPAVPEPWLDEHPAPEGYAVSIAVQTQGSLTSGALSLLQVMADSDVVLGIELRASVDPDQPELVVTATHANGTPFPTFVAPVAASRLSEGAVLHVALSAQHGVPFVFVDGERLVSSVEPTPVPGTPAGGYDMMLSVGGAGANGAPDVGFDALVRHLHWLAHPYGPIDSRLRKGLTPASSWRVGDPISLVRTEDGHTPSGEAFTTTVTEINGSQLTLESPLPNAWLSGHTLIYSHRLFVHQRQTRRRDDVMNHSYRISTDYRVSTFLSLRRPPVSAPAAFDVTVELRELARLKAEQAVVATEEVGVASGPDYPLRPGQTSPGVEAKLVSSTASSIAAHIQPGSSQVGGG